MKHCIHNGCTQKTYSNDPLCKFHRDELENNGKPGHWICSWCTNYFEAQSTMEQEKFSNVL